MYLSEDGTLTVIHMAFIGEDMMVIQFDSDGNVINQLSPPSHFLVRNHNGEIFNTKNTSASDFYHTSSDTLYHYNKKSNKIEPTFTLSFNSSEIPLHQYIEMNNLYFTSIWSKGQTIMTDIKTKTSTFVKIQNDFWGNIDVSCNVITFRNGWYMSNLEPWQLIELIEKRLLESDCSNQDKQKLTALRETLDENANNVLLFGKLKNK
jgi:hypothetical protein